MTASGILPVIYPEVLRFANQAATGAYGGVCLADPMMPLDKAPSPWVIAAARNAAFVTGMEDVLEVDQRPHDPECPVVWLDDASKQLIAETRVPIPAKPGHPARHDYEYEPNGTANSVMMFAPLEGWRIVKVTERRAAVDYRSPRSVQLSDL